MPATPQADYKFDPPQTFYDPDANETHSWIMGKHVITPGRSGTMGGPSDPKVTRDSSGNIDWGKTARDWASDLVPAATTMLAPELAPGIKAMSPLMQVLSKMGIGAVAGTAVDQGLNYGTGKPLLNSAVDSTANAVLGNLPEAANVGFNIPGVTRKTLISSEPTVMQRTNSGTGSTQSSSVNTSTSAMPFDTITIRQNAKGLFVTPYQVKIPKNLGPDVPTAEELAKMPRKVQAIFNKFQGNPGDPDLNAAFQELAGPNRPQQPPVNTSTNVSQSTTGSSGTGQTVINPGDKTILAEKGYPGIVGHLLDIIKNTQSYPRVRSSGAPILSPLQVALAGLGINMGTDYMQNKP